jgi:hypothetical protein
MLLIPPSISKHLLLLLLSLSRVIDGTESGEDLVSEAMWVVGGDTATPVTVMNLLLGSSAGADSTPMCGKYGRTLAGQHKKQHHVII